MRIKELRESLHLNQREAAKCLDITYTEYAKLENGEVEPTMGQLLCLADTFGVSVDYLLEHDTPASKGETTWLNIRRSLPEDKLKIVAQMLNGVNDLQLNENDIENICNLENDRLNDCASTAKMRRLFNDYDDDELTFDDYLILKKIADGEKISFKDENVDTHETNYSFTYEGKFYSKTTVAKILKRLDNKFNLLGYYFILKKTKQGYEGSDENYYDLNKKGKKVLKELEEKIKS